jgi:hypothetical protein
MRRFEGDAQKDCSRNVLASPSLIRRQTKVGNIEFHLQNSDSMHIKPPGLSFFNYEN